MHETGHSGLVHWDDPEGWDVEGGAITPLKMGNITPIDLLVLLGVSLLVWLFARTSHILSRLEGGIMIIIYLCYIVYLIFAQ